MSTKRETAGTGRRLLPSLSQGGPSMRGVWPFSFNVLLFAGYAAAGPFFVLFYQSLGFTGTEIGLLTGLGPLITLVSAPWWTRFADRTSRHRLVMTLALGVGVCTYVALPTLRAFALVLLMSALLSVFSAPVTPLADSAAMFMLSDRKEMYGRIRLGGTIGYGLSASAAGVLVHAYGLKAAFWSCAGLFLLALLTSQKLVYSRQRPDAPRRGGGVGVLLATPQWLLFLAMAFAGGLALASYNYLFPYMKELGASETTMGLALTIGTIVEVPVLFFGNRLIRRFKASGVFTLATAATGVRLLLYSVARSPDHVLWIQLLNGVTFPLVWVAGVSYAYAQAPEGMTATAQGLLTAVVYGFGMAVGGFIAGPLLEEVGGRGLYLIFGIAVLCMVTVVVFLQRRLRAPRDSSSQAASP